MNIFIKFILTVLVLAIILGLAYWVYNFYYTAKNPAPISNADLSSQKALTKVDAQNATYTINGQAFKLTNGKAENLMIFGEPFFGDLNGDGAQDAALMLVYNPSGSGTFYYIASAIKDTANNLIIGSNAILLGDRIAPQNIAIDSAGKITVNYADRQKNEPLSTPPSIGVSRYFFVDGSTLVENSGK